MDVYVLSDVNFNSMSKDAFNTFILTTWYTGRLIEMLKADFSNAKSIYRIAWREHMQESMWFVEKEDAFVGVWVFESVPF